MPAVDLDQVTDEATLRDLHSVVDAVYATDFVALPADPLVDILPGLSGRLNDHPTEYWLGRVDGLPVVSIRIQHSDHDNVDVANVQLDVHPSYRGRGYGSAGLGAAMERARDLGKRRIHGEVPSRTVGADPSPAIGLMQKYDAKLLLTERRRLLDVAGIDDLALTRLLDSARDRADGYSIVTFRDEAPDEFVADLAVLNASMSTDPPQGELALEPEVWDSARYRAHEQSVRDRGRIRLFAVACHDATGRLAGFTDLGVPAGDGAVGYQWSTIVSEDHRGHRLGMLMKAANLQYLRRELPSVQYLNTWNAETNSYMIAVNEALGFRTQESWSEYGLDL